MPWYVDVILPLPLAESYTYLIPEAEAEGVQAGSRVVVQFGAKRYYTALVVRKYTEVPQGGYEIKEVVEVLDTTPIVLPLQLQLWRWIASYYMCAMGDVYKAALPSGLKIESDTVVELNEAFMVDEPLRDKEQMVLDALLLNPKQRIQQLVKNCSLRNGMRIIKSLLDKGALFVDEAMRLSYKPRNEVHVRLCEAYRSEDALNEALSMLKRAVKRAMCTRRRCLRD